MTRLPIPWLANDPDAPFPPVSRALREPNGLLAAGGDLAPRRLLEAYRHGIFPWFMPGEPILWWSPDPRCVFRTGAMHVARRFRRDLKRSHWRIVADTRFVAVIDACAAARRDGGGTWITPAMRDAYVALHRLGHAHSIEVLDGERLVGGLYGVRVGALFCAESMFSGETHGSKVALLALARALAAEDVPLIDAQVASPHLFTLGASLMRRVEFAAYCAQAAAVPAPAGFASRVAIRAPELAAG